MFPSSVFINSISENWRSCLMGFNSHGRKLHCVELWRFKIWGYFRQVRIMWASHLTYCLLVCLGVTTKLRLSTNIEIWSSVSWTMNRLTYRILSLTLRLRPDSSLLFLGTKSNLSNASLWRFWRPPSTHTTWIQVGLLYLQLVSCRYSPVKL